MATTAQAETLQFQAETKQLLDLMIHSLYSNKEIFLRELISNASDALDRLRFESLTRPELLAGDEKIDETLEIRLEADRDNRTLTISDNGIGMSRDEVIANIGTIAKSGTRELVKQLKESGSQKEILEFIGQFGVGFYSSFMVSERVELITRRAGEETATRWESTGDGTYTIE
ncbi:MAG: ATP-binding protein, partial [Thermoanaerobaculia bacterium]